MVHVCASFWPRREAMLRDRYGPDRIDPPAHDENAKTPVIHILGYDAAGEPIVTQPRTNWRSITKPVAAWQRQSVNIELSLSQLSHESSPSIFASSCGNSIDINMLGSDLTSIR